MDALNDLQQLYEKLTQFENLIKRRLNAKPPYATETEMQTLSAELQRDYSRLDSVLERYGGYGVNFNSPLLDKMYGKKIYLLYDIALGSANPTNYVGKLKAINELKQIINKAIGKLEKEGESQGVRIQKYKNKSKKPKVFISYSGNSPALTELREYLDELDIEKFIVGKKPNLDRTINVKVENYLDEADFVIILATGDSRDRNSNIIPAGNVIHEIGLAQAKPKFKGKIIYLLEEGAEFPSNIKPKGYIRFNRDNIEHKFGDIVKEIKEMGFLH